MCAAGQLRSVQATHGGGLVGRPSPRGRRSSPCRASLCLRLSGNDIEGDAVPQCRQGAGRARGVNPNDTNSIGPGGHASLTDAEGSAGERRRRDEPAVPVGGPRSAKSAVPTHHSTANHRGDCAPPATAQPVSYQARRHRVRPNPDLGRQSSRAFMVHCKRERAALPPQMCVCVCRRCGVSAVLACDALAGG